MPDLTRKLADLSDQELAELLGLTLGEAREWLRVSESLLRGDKLHALDIVTMPSRISSMLQSIKHLARVSVKEVQWLIHSGELYRLYPYYDTRPPEHIGLRWRQLRDLLSDENEFSTRYPAAYEAVYGRLPTSGLPLPSLGVRVARNAPQAHLIRAGWFSEWRGSQESSDAYSATFHHGEKGVPLLTRSTYRWTSDTYVGFSSRSLSEKSTRSEWPRNFIGVSFMKVQKRLDLFRYVSPTCAWPRA